MTPFPSRNRATSEVGPSRAGPSRPTTLAHHLDSCCLGGEAQPPDIHQNPPKSRFRRAAHGSICIQEGQPIDPINLFLLLLQDSVAVLSVIL
jgi:hypothetical protein